MNSGALLLVVINFILIGLLPLVFFHRGSFNLAWIATAAPFFIDGAIVLLGLLGVLQPSVDIAPSWASGMHLTAVALSAGSILLIGLTIGTHRVPLALWHQDNDAPVEIVTWGPYARIRHPFYSSFLLAFLAAVLVLPHFVTAGLMLYGAIVLTVTARGEEKRLSESEFGNQYQDYMKTTGRFFPRLRSAP